MVVLVLFEYSKEMNRFYSQAFHSTPIKSIKIPPGVTEILGSGNYGAFEKSALEVIEFEAGSKLTSIGGRVSYFSLRNLWSCSYSSNILNK